MASNVHVSYNFPVFIKVLTVFFNTFLNGVLFRFRYQVLDYHSSTSALVFRPGSFPLFLRFGWRLDIEAALTCVGNAAIWRTWIASAVAISVSVIFSVKPRRVPVSFLRLGRKDFADFFVRQMALQIGFLHYVSFDVHILCCKGFGLIWKDFLKVFQMPKKKENRMSNVWKKQKNQKK